PVEYGRYSLLLYTALITVTLTFHWVQVSILRFMGHPSRETGIVLSRFYDLTLFGALISTLIVLTTGLLYFHLNIPELILVALFTFLSHFYFFHLALLQVHHRSIRMAILEGSDQLLLMIVLLAGLFLFDYHRSALIFGAMVTGLAGTLLLRFILRVKGLFIIDRTRVYWDSRFSGKVVSFGYGITLWLFCSHVIMAADRFILMEYFGYHVAGSYSAIKDLISKTVIFAGLPIYISYQTKIMDLWHAHRKAEAWTVVKEAISFQMLVYILVFIVFMVIKSVLFKDYLRIPEMNFWVIYLPLLLAAFLWQSSLLMQRFLELIYRPFFMLTAIAVCAILNIVLNVAIVPKHGIISSSLIMLATSLLYAGFIFVLSVLGRKKLTE
ncbi:MAG: hypothetical protein WCI71_08810, partial [Bacteroidota bacterium]